MYNVRQQVTQDKLHHETQDEPYQQCHLERSKDEILLSYLIL
jgi:hypothetical protein